MKRRPPILPIAAFAALALLRPGSGAAAPTVTIVDGSSSIVSAGLAYRAAPGVRLRACDVVRTTPQSLVQVEFDGGAAIAVGGEGGGFVVSVPGVPGPGTDVHVLVSGWAKLTVPKTDRPAPHRLSTPHFDVLVPQGVTVVHAGDKRSELFVERGETIVLAQRGQPQVTLAAGRFLARTAGGGGSGLDDSAKKPFLDAMPRAFRDTLPSLRKNFEGRETAPARATGGEDTPPLPAIPELRSCLADVTIRHAQEVLQRLGIAVGPIDGIRGPRTEAALREFQLQRGLPPSGVLDAETLSVLDDADRR